MTYKKFINWTIGITSLVIGLLAGWAGYGTVQAIQSYVTPSYPQVGVGGGPSINTTERTDLNTWPIAAKNAAQQMLGKYGQPNVSTTDMLIWYNRSPWKRIVVYKNEIIHTYPYPHSDVLEETVNFQVPATMMTQLALFDSSILVNRTAGEFSSRCVSEPMNITALNLAHDVITGVKTVDQARNEYSGAVNALKSGEKPSVSQKLKFAL